MAFPAINYCMVCESVRPEMGGKLSVLGLFGLTPVVDIGVLKLDQPLVLTVLFGFSPVTDAQAYNYSIVISNPDGSVLFQSSPTKVNTLPGKPGVIASTFASVPKTVGLRKIRVVVNGETKFESQFTIRKAEPQELAGMPGATLQ